ncbi:D-alanyl-D-alanine carboxypeptidase family protein [Rhizobium halophytocola]|uniref:serine-type D-Ala-D-Ala carboxypeptidase n=1 Tax=Rhizobium halophytocola TaxID=735519 RepID=A0ABS4DWQ5_9HYPH|nr:D-alanyl-D-alanine carboxypeptidase family protein [Rhizobium halophytocola]MBP1850133.1 D-alanyl-D-alanine carboxypeptidase (penicillin-binding protein 5/6) [Rhizobium halophytocola]
MPPRLAVPATFILCLLTAFPAAAAVIGDFQPKAGNVLLIEASTGTVLLSKDEDAIIPPASLTKMMVADVVFEALKSGEITPDTTYKVSEHAWRTGGAPSHTATMFAALKSEIRVEDLIKGVIVQMANDGCIILAEGMDGSEAKFAARMTARAKELGLAHTAFANATGLPAPGNKTTIADMVKLARHLQETYPDFYQIYAQPDFEWNKIFQRNKNPLLSHGLGVDGLVTGYAEEAGYGLVVSALHDGNRFFLGLSGLDNEADRRDEADRILRWAEGSFERRRVFQAGDVVGQASVYGGASGDVDLAADGPVDVFVPANDPALLDARIVYHWPLKAPVARDAAVGRLQISLNDHVLREVPLKTIETVPRGKLWQRSLDALVEGLFFWL